jgi:hypothetical protein
LASNEPVTELDQASSKAETPSPACDAVHPVVLGAGTPFFPPMRRAIND